MASLSELPPPLSCIGIVAIIIVYLLICYLVIDFTVHDENRSGDMDHGLLLSEEVLQNITYFYNHNLGHDTCAICLDYLQNGELCRVLPACNHVFHAECLDPWLAKQLTCPTCRAPFETEPRYYF
ncbi:OLC1v1017958C1 [Oldenlandia corymbosa var. corymbosa]|uniref:OLC1v1017958C1 n=1 Tax=Oldenlandia corymbosa var. corymbosa TaxID=529605 RepID=A0AAV1EAL6_OLDCO|nr:OLC1v1017958C1 [Oldenlandia corymbosa var. corymbosa]